MLSKAFPDKSYPAKLLLFGEQTVLKGSNALAIPFPQFHGAWRMPNDEAPTPDPLLLPFLKYLENKVAQKKLPFHLIIDAFRSDIEAGLRFDSSIPIGYGAGSSGALCAAIYDRYANSTLAPIESNLAILKQQLASLENFFHGKSSGTDPLIIYLNQPILIEHGKGISIANLKRKSLKESNHYSYFLIDTGIKRKTETYVNRFLKNCETSTYHKMVETELNPTVNRTIEYFIEGNDEEVYKEMKIISELQLSYFESFIPQPFKELWKTFLEKENIYLKLCGAGGGGFLFGIKETKKDIEKSFSVNIIPLQI